MLKGALLMMLWEVQLAQSASSPGHCHTASFANMPPPSFRLPWQQALVPLTRQSPQPKVIDLPPPQNDEQSWASVRHHGNAFREQETLRELLLLMLRASEFAYMYASLRRIVLKHDATMGDGDGLVQFDSPERVRDLFDNQRKVSCRLLQRPIQAMELLDFMQRNRNYIRQDPGGALRFNPHHASSSADLPYDRLFLEDTLDLFRSNDGRLLDYDDELTASGGLVYGITSNRLKKRLTVTFRGSVGALDFQTCANYHLDEEVFTFLGPGVKIHAGFASYLFHQIEGGATKFRRIVDCLKHYYDNAPPDVRDDFDLYVSGHSLGGALAILFASAAVASEASHPVFRKIRVATFAAPLVGNREFDQAIRKYEKSGQLKLLRISNEGDVIATRHFFRNYVANGVNMHLLRDGTIEFKHGNTKFITSQMVGDLLENHSFPEHERRLFLDAEHPVLNQSYDEVYLMLGEFDYEERSTSNDNDEKDSKQIQQSCYDKGSDNHDGSDNNEQHQTQQNAVPSSKWRRIKGVFKKYRVFKSGIRPE